MLRLTMPLPGHVLAGISGGADSVALLHLLRQTDARIMAVHVNHGLRGEASDGDAQFVASLCAAWHIPLRTYRATPPAHPSEDWARQVRYGFFREAMAATGADALVLAHHQDDQAETLLLHLLRGAGLNGLAGMAPDTVVEGMRILRPLLGVSRQALRDMLTALGQPWREDASNADPRYLRNALRADILPRLEQLAPGASARLATTAALLREEAALLDAQVADFLRIHGGQAEMPLAPLQAKPVAMQRRILRAWWQGRAGESCPEHTLSAAQTEAFAALVAGKAGQRCNLPGNWHGQRGWTHLHLVSPENTPVFPKTSPLHPETSPYTGDHGDGKRTQVLPASWLEGLELRTRRPGDWIIPFGSAGRKSLQDYLVDRHIDAPFRDRIPLLCRGSEVLLVGGVGAGNVPRTQDEPAVLLTWRMDFPWLNESK